MRLKRIFILLKLAVYSKHKLLDSHVLRHIFEFFLNHAVFRLVKGTAKINSAIKLPPVGIEPGTSCDSF